MTTQQHLQRATIKSLEIKKAKIIANKLSKLGQVQALKFQPDSALYNDFEISIYHPPGADIVDKYIADVKWDKVRD